MSAGSLRQRDDRATDGQTQAVKERRERIDQSRWTSGGHGAPRAGGRGSPRSSRLAGGCRSGENPGPDPGFPLRRGGARRDGRSRARTGDLLRVRDGTRTAKVATARKDGRPHVVPVWFVLDGEDVMFTTGASSIKGQALRRDPYACLCVDDQAPPVSFVRLEGPIELSTDLDELRRVASRRVATRIGRRYMGVERADEFGAAQRRRG